MNAPILIEKDSFQEAWLEAAVLLLTNKWDLWNIVVHIKNPILMNEDINKKVTCFLKIIG